MLKRIKDKYPSTVIICGTLMKTKLKSKPNWKLPSDYNGYDISKYNRMIRKCCLKYKCILCDLADTGKNMKQYTLLMRQRTVIKLLLIHG